MKLFFAGFILIFLFTNFGYTQQVDSIALAQEYHSDGYELMLKGKFTKAIDQFDKAILLNPLDANYYHNRAYCLNEIDSFNLAELDYKQAISIDPTNYEYYYLLGNIYQNNGDFEVAADYYSQALNIINTPTCPDLYIILFNRGNCYLKNNMYEKAIYDYDSSLKANPAHLPSYANIGVAKFKSGDTLGACFNWHVAFINEMSEVESYYKYNCSGFDFSDSIIPNLYTTSNTRIDSGLFVSNPNDYYIFAEKMPGFPGGEVERIKYLNENIYYPLEAREAGIQGRVFISFIVEKDGTITNVKVERGIGGGCDEAAVDIIEKMPKWEPAIQFGKPVRVQFNMPILFRLNEGPPYSEPDFDFNDGIYKMNKGDNNSAIKHFTKSIKKEGRFYKESYANRGICYYNLNNIELAYSDLNEAIKLNAKITPEIVGNAYYNIALEYLKQKKYNLAIDGFSLAISLNPSDAEAYYNRAVAYFYSNQNTKACDDWDTAKSLGLDSAQQLINQYCK